MTGMSPEQSCSLPQEKSKKYDRQLRLWGDHGQSALEVSRVCLVHATATGNEVLKNLILPGIGSFTIVDDRLVTGEDVGNNFFLKPDAIGRSRAATSTKYLLELNEDVVGDYVEDNVESILNNNSIFFSNFSLVIVTDVPEKTLLRLADQLWQWNIPLIVCRSYGMAGYMRLVLKEHTVVESHPDSALDDLRLNDPFPALCNYCESFDLEKMSLKEHSHTPWLIIIYKYLQEWKTQHDGKLPKTYKEKQQLKEMIRDGIRKNPDGVPEQEENFEEAIMHVNTALQPSTIPSEVKEIFDDDACVNLTAESSSFWIFAHAVKEFVEHEGKGYLPLRGSIPDMTSDSERYIQLQNIYRDKAQNDATIVATHVSYLLQELGRDQPLAKRYCRSPTGSPRQVDLTEADINKFCHNCYFLRVQRGQSLQQEYHNTSASIIDSKIAEDPNANMYALFRAIDRFEVEFGRKPGVGEDWEGDVSRLKGVTTAIASNVEHDWLHEFCRWGAAELHSVAAFMGGTAAQEVIKVLTQQFVPVNNTFLYNAVQQSSLTLKF